jgi:hypothetical protein
MHKKRKNERDEDEPMMSGTPKVCTTILAKASTLRSEDYVAIVDRTTCNKQKEIEIISIVQIQQP